MPEMGPGARTAPPPTPTLGRTNEHRRDGTQPVPPAGRARRARVPGLPVRLRGPVDRHHRRDPLRARKGVVPLLRRRAGLGRRLPHFDGVAATGRAFRHLAAGPGDADDQPDRHGRRRPPRPVVGHLPVRVRQPAGESVLQAGARSPNRDPHRRVRVLRPHLHDAAASVDLRGQHRRVLQRRLGRDRRRDPHPPPDLLARRGRFVGGAGLAAPGCLRTRRLEARRLPPGGPASCPVGHRRRFRRRPVESGRRDDGRDPGGGGGTPKLRAGPGFPVRLRAQPLPVRPGDDGVHRHHRQRRPQLQQRGLQLDLRRRSHALFHDARPQLAEPSLRPAVPPGVRVSVEAPPRAEDLFPTAAEYRRLLDRRTRRARLFQAVCLLALTTAVVALATLVYTVVIDSFGWVAIVNAREPEEVVADLGYDPAEVSLADVPYDDLVGLLESTIPTGVGRRLEREQRFYEDRLVFEAAASWDALCASERAPSGCTAPPRDHANVLALVEERVIVPDVIASYDLVPSLLDPDGFTRRLEEGFAAGRFPDVDIDSVHIEWRNWFNPRFLRTPASSIPEIAGIRTAILG